MTLVDMIYAETAAFPRGETFALTAQLRRAAVSVPSNIAEGAARNSSREFLHFLGVTCGSIAEVETQLELAIRLGFIQRAPDVLRQANRVGYLVRLLRLSLKKSLD